MDAVRAGVNERVKGIALKQKGDTIRKVSYAERIARGKEARLALKAYDIAKSKGNRVAMDSAHNELKKNYEYFGYGYFNDPSEAIPDVPLVFWSFHIMVYVGGWLLIFFILVLIFVYKGGIMQRSKFMQWIAILSIPLVYICSECGWVTAELGRQPWIIEGLMPTRAALSDVTTSVVITTFCMFAVIFTGLLIAEISIMVRQIKKRSMTDIENDNQ